MPSKEELGDEFLQGVAKGAGVTVGGAAMATVVANPGVAAVAAVAAGVGAIHVLGAFGAREHEKARQNHVADIRANLKNEPQVRQLRAEYIAGFMHNKLG